MAQLALQGVLTMAHVVDWLTARQVRYKLGALPVLYALLDTLQVRPIINRHCPTQADVDHGTVALVLVLNRLLLPLPLYQITDWIGQTVLVAVLGIPFGFAHNTPSNKRKLKLGLDAAADGNLPVRYQAWSGRTADQATVETNLDNLTAWLRQHGRPLQDTLVVGDRAMLNAEIALLYDRCGLRHLTGLKAATPDLKALIAAWSDAQIEDQRIATMLFINMLALLAYTVLQRQVRQQGLQITTRRVIQRLEPLTLIETHCWDGGTLRRLAHVEPDLLCLLHLVAVALDELIQTAALTTQPLRLLAAGQLAPERLLPAPRLC